MTSKTPADIAKALRGFYETHLTSLQGIMDKLPEGLRPALKGLYDDLNSQLAKLPPLEQVPAAAEAAGSLNWLADCVVRMQEYAASLVDRISGITAELTKKSAAYQGLEDKITSGELVTKEKATELAGIAKQQGVDSVLPQIIDMRKAQVELAGLPAAPDAVLSLPAADYKTRLDLAVANVKKLGEKGLKLNGRGKGFVTELAWLPTAEFDGKLTSYGDILGGGAGAAGAFDPLKGGGEAGTETKSEPAKRTARMVAC